MTDAKLDNEVGTELREANQAFEQEVNDAVEDSREETEEYYEAQRLQEEAKQFSLRAYQRGEVLTPEQHLENVGADVSALDDRAEEIEDTQEEEQEELEEVAQDAQDEAETEVEEEEAEEEVSEGEEPEEQTAAEVVESIKAASSVEEVDALAEGDDRVTVQKAAAKRKKELASA